MRKTVIFAKSIVYSMDYDNLHLENKTFLDFTNDPEIISKVLGGYSCESFLSAVQYTPALRWNTFSSFADLISDEMLASQILDCVQVQLRSLRDE